MSQRIPPVQRFPWDFACCGPGLERVTCGVPVSKRLLPQIQSDVTPATLFAFFARSLKSGCKGVSSCALMTCPFPGLQFAAPRNLGFEVFLQMMAGKIKRLVLFRCRRLTIKLPSRVAGDQRCQFRRIDIGNGLSLSLPSLPRQSIGDDPTNQVRARRGPRSQLRIAIVGIDRRVQQRASSRHQPRAPVPEIS